MSLRIVLVGEWLHGSDDEGIHNLATSLAREWSSAHRVDLLRIGEDLVCNRLFVSRELCRRLQAFAPDLVFYVSPSSANLAALFRARLLKWYSPSARVLVCALQPVSFSRAEAWIAIHLAPDGVFAQSPSTLKALNAYGLRAHFLPSGVDTERFVPVPVSQKAEIRWRLGIPQKAFVILHVGHINTNRNVRLLAAVPPSGETEVILVGSTRTPVESGLREQLRTAGVRVVQNYLPHIQEFYQASDAYLFPVVTPGAAIGVPLSVLEAMACNLPVITTRFEGLPMMFEEGLGYYYLERETDLPLLLARVRGLADCATRRMVEPYSWSKVAGEVLAQALKGA